MKRAFSLVEMLVVLVVIAVLAALLFPVYAKARHQSIHSRRVSDMRQVAVALSCYMDDGGRLGLAPHADIDAALDPYAGNQTARLMRRGVKGEQFTYYLYPNPYLEKPRSCGVYDFRHGPFYGWDVPLGGGAPRYWEGTP